MMRQKDMPTWMPDLLDIVFEAGHAVMSVYRSGQSHVQTKADLSPLTDADRAAHMLLAKALPKLQPHTAVVSEEDADSLKHRHASGQFWLIDPLDGTKEFLARSGEFTVNVALVEDGKALLGVVYAPALNQMYWGGAAHGSWRKWDQQAAQTVRVSPKLVGSLCRVVASKSHMNDDTREWIKRLGPTQLVQAGSSLKFCRLAEGAADVYPRMGPTCEWDTAAAQAVLEGAGGGVMDLQGFALRYGKANVLNPAFVAVGDKSWLAA
jgi:3'(2'), 5'-bisphosphate nucleotidase